MDNRANEIDSLGRRQVKLKPATIAKLKLAWFDEDSQTGSNRCGQARLHPFKNWLIRSNQPRLVHNAPNATVQKMLVGCEQMDQIEIRIAVS